MLESLLTYEWQCTDEPGVDSFGDSCQWYYEHPEGCGAYDSETFDAYEDCCACDGGDWELGCTDYDGVDSFGDSCAWYEDNEEECGMYDTADFIATEACCFCEGGYWW